MKTERLTATNPEHVARAGQLLRNGELVAVPTETVYGLAADASNADAVARIFAAKNRPSDHPLITHLASLDQLPHWAVEIPDWVDALAQRFWPGPLTLLLKKHPAVSDVITGGLPTIGLRVPDHPVLLSLLREFDLAVAAPSANPYKKLSPTHAEQVYAGLNGRIAAILDGGPCEVGVESTIVRVSDDKAEILRSGPIKAADLQPLLPVPVEAPSVHAHRVSGNKEEHYQPCAKVILLGSEEMASAMQRSGGNDGYLVYTSGLAARNAPHTIQLSEKHHLYRKMLYASLYQLDQQACSRILVERPPAHAEWLDIQDRLERAAGPSSE